jgi:hypothetical protein
MPAAFQHVDETDEVAVHVGMGVHEGIPHPRLGAQVDDRFEAMRLEQLLHPLPVGQIEAKEPERRDLLQLAETGLFEIHAVVVVEVVQTEHLIPPLQQGAGEMEPDETGRSGDEDAHAHPSEVVGCGWCSVTARSQGAAGSAVTEGLRGDFNRSQDATSSPFLRATSHLPSATAIGGVTP